MESDAVSTALPASRKRGVVRRRLTNVVVALVGVAVLLLAAFLVLGAVTGNHTLGSVSYAQVPPHSGDHSPVWQRCGFYGEPVGDEHAVHSLEHGAVWITHQPDLPPAQIEALRAVTQSQKDVLVSPYPGLPAPVVVSVWGRQVRLDAVDDAQLAKTLHDIRSGPAAPEPGGGCDGPNLWLTGATGNPEG
jgi:hypothetical protein